MQHTTTMYNTILLVDDDPVNNFLNKRVLENLQICKEIVVAQNGMEGLQYLKGMKLDHQSPNLVIVDVKMPVMDGFEFVEAFNEFPLDKRESVKIIMLSSSRNPKDISRSKELGVDNYFTKPLTETIIKNIAEL